MQPLQKKQKIKPGKGRLSSGRGVQSASSKKRTSTGTGWKDPTIDHINQSTSRKSSKKGLISQGKSGKNYALKTGEQKMPDLQVRYMEIDVCALGQRLDNFLIGQLKGVPKTHVYRIIRSGEVRVNKARAQADTRLEAGDVVRIPPVKLEQTAPRAPAPAREFPVLFEDDVLLAVNKPAGVAVHGGSGVSFGVIEQLRQARPQSRFLELAHRLDRETSGILVLAKKRSALTALQEQFRQRETGKTYLALVKGRWDDVCSEGSKTIRVPLYKYLNAQGERRVRATEMDDPQGKSAVSIVQPVREFKGFSLLSVTIKTGRTHQIRVHLVHAGLPIVGDDKYGDFELNKAVAKQYDFERMFLHAYRLAFVHPLTGEKLVVQAELPEACQQILQLLDNE